MGCATVVPGVDPARAGRGPRRAGSTRSVCQSGPACTKPRVRRAVGPGRRTGPRRRRRSAEQALELGGQLEVLDGLRRRVLRPDPPLGGPPRPLLLGALGRVAAAPALLALAPAVLLLARRRPCPACPASPACPPPRDICAIILRASKNRSTSWLTSVTSLPEPLAMRGRREPLRILASRRSAGVIDWMIAVTRSISRSSMLAICSRISPMPGQHAEQLGHRAHLATACIWCEEVLEGELAGAATLAAMASAWSASKAFSACSMRVSTSPMPRMREAIRSGWKTSKSSSFSPLEANMTGRPVTVRDRQRGATAGVAVELGEDDAVEADAVEERLRGGDRVLADHRVDDEEDLVGVDGVADVGGLLHQLVVDAEPAGGVDDDDVVELQPGVRDRRPRHRHRVARRRCRAPARRPGRRPARRRPGAG